MNKLKLGCHRLYSSPPPTRRVQELHVLDPLQNTRRTGSHGYCRYHSSSSGNGSSNDHPIGPIETSEPSSQQQRQHQQRKQQKPSTASLQLGSLSLSSNLILSPLERVSDVGFRNMCFQNGAALTWTEMVYGSELVQADTNNSSSNKNSNNKSRGYRGAALIDTYDPATPTGVQLLMDRTTRRDNWGVDLLQRCLEKLEEGATSGNSNDNSNNSQQHWQSIVAIDLNFGCPSPSISKRGAGPAQLRRRSKIRALFQHLTEWKQSQTSLPHLGAVGAKMRLGNTKREQDYQVYLPVAEAAADVGLDYLTVHARHGGQRSSDPKLSWECVREMKDAIQQTDTKIIANGDIRTHADVRRVTELTQCDGVMIGRAAMRNPWCFSSLKTGAQEVWPTLDQVEEAHTRHCNWSQQGPAEARYQRFREETFERLRRMTENSKPCADTTKGTDWYQEWSQAANRRRHLEKVDDGYEK